MIAIPYGRSTEGGTTPFAAERTQAADRLRAAARSKSGDVVISRDAAIALADLIDGDNGAVALTVAVKINGRTHCGRQQADAA